MVLSERAARIAALGFHPAADARETISACNLCGSARFVTITHEDRYGFDCPTDACLRCGLCFLNPRPTADAYAAFYERTYRPLVSAFHGRLIDASSVEAEQPGYAASVAAALEQYVKTPGTRLLDVGGSAGVVAEVVAAAHGLTPVVLDPSPDEVARAVARGLEGHVGTIEDHEIDPSNRYGVVLLCQTVDHLLDVRGALTTIRSLLVDDGVFFVDIVDFRAAYLRNGSIEAATKVDHPYSLTEKTMEAYLSVGGFRVLHKDYAADHLHVGYVCRPDSPHEALPTDADVAEFFAEIRAVQNPGSPT